MNGEIKKARLYISGLGLYEAYFVPEKAAKGEKKISCVEEGAVKLGDEYLTPFYNDYDRWVQYQTMDVTDTINGSGTIQVMLGNGWYKARFGFKPTPNNAGLYGDDWMMIAELHLLYADGHEEVICSDDSWTVKRSKITFSNIYDGEHADETLPEMPVEKAVCHKGPKGKLTDRMSTRLICHHVFTPAKLIDTPAGEKVFDLG